MSHPASRASSAATSTARRSASRSAVLCGGFDPSFLAVAFGTTTDHVFVETLGLMSRAPRAGLRPAPRTWLGASGLGASADPGLGRDLPRRRRQVIAGLIKSPHLATAGPMRVGGRLHGRMAALVRRSNGTETAPGLAQSRIGRLVGLPTADDPKHSHRERSHNYFRRRPLLHGAGGCASNPSLFAGWALLHRLLDGALVSSYEVCRSHGASIHVAVSDRCGLTFVRLRRSTITTSGNGDDGDRHRHFSSAAVRLRSAPRRVQALRHHDRTMSSRRTCLVTGSSGRNPHRLSTIGSSVPVDVAAHPLAGREVRSPIDRPRMTPKVHSADRSQLLGFPIADVHKQSRHLRLRGYGPHQMWHLAALRCGKRRSLGLCREHGGRSRPSWGGRLRALAVHARPLPPG
jgi:hypothetical protein